MAWTSKIFSERVMKILTELDFHDFRKVTKNVFKATLKLGKIEVPVVIDIYYSRKKSIQEDEVKMYYADINMVKGFVKGIFIGYPEFNPKAKEVAEKLDIITLDIYELLNSLVDMDNYREALKNIYRDDIKNYIPHNLSNKDQHMELSNFISQLERNDNAPFFVEGDIGIGKTTLLKSLMSQMGKKASRSLRSRIPFYLDLKQYASYSSLEDFIFQEAFRKNQIKIRSNEAFDILCSEGRLVFFLDNLDKLGPAESEQILKLGDELTLLAKKGVMLVVASLEGYISVDFKNKLYYTKFLRKFENLNPEIYKIRHFSLAQIKQKLTNPKLQRIISRNEFLKEVCKIPVFLDIFSNLEIKQEESLVKFSDIYKESIRQWQTDYLTSLGKETLCEEMARALLKSGDFSVQTDLPEYLENFIQNQYKALPFSQELLKADLKRSFFIRETSKEHYEFIHSSFMYFFVAIRLVEEIKKGNYSNIFLLSSSLILKFVEDFLGKDKIFDVIIERYNRERFSRDKGEVLFLLYQVAEALDCLKEMPLNRISTHKIEAPNKMLVNLQLFDIDFRESDFRNSDFRFSRCMKIDFSSSIMENVNFSHADFKRSTFNLTNLKYLISRKANFSESSFFKTNLFQASCLMTDFSKSHFNHTNMHGILGAESSFKGAEFMSVEMSNGDFTRADFTESKLENMQCKSGLFAFANFLRSQLKNIDFAFSIFHETNFVESQLQQVNFDFLNLRGSSFEKANLNKVSLKDADLRSVSFKGSFLTEVDLSGADLRGADFTGAKLCEETKKSLALALK